MLRVVFLRSNKFKTNLGMRLRPSVERQGHQQFQCWKSYSNIYSKFRTCFLYEHQVHVIYHWTGLRDYAQVELSYCVKCIQFFTIFSITTLMYICVCLCIIFSDRFHTQDLQYSKNCAIFVLDTFNSVAMLNLAVSLERYGHDLLNDVSENFRKIRWLVNFGEKSKNRKSATCQNFWFIFSMILTPSLT